MAKYWLSVLGCTLVAGLLMGGAASFNSGEILFGIVLGLPGIQLVASIVACIAIACSSRPDKAASYEKVGKITAWSVIGTMIGVGIMYLAYLAIKGAAL